MITNPTVGMRVRLARSLPERSVYLRVPYQHQVGTIVSVEQAIYPIRVRFDDLGNPPSEVFDPAELDALLETPEEQDQKRRQEHADRYL